MLYPITSINTGENCSITAIGLNWLKKDAPTGLDFSLFLIIEPSNCIIAVSYTHLYNIRTNIVPHIINKVLFDLVKSIISLVLL